MKEKMQNLKQVRIQIGKNGLTEGLMASIENSFKTHKDVKVSVLKAGGHEKGRVKEMADGIVEKLGKNYTYRIVGFTIFIKKWRKAVR